MTQKTKKTVYNFNLFVLVVLIGFLMYWQKNVRFNTTNTPSVTYETASSVVVRNNGLETESIFK